MLSKSQISFVKSLHRKKFRKEEGLFIAEGEKVVEELMASELSIKKIFATSGFIDSHQRLKGRNYSCEWNEVSEQELSKISLLTTPNQVIALAEIPSHTLHAETLQSKLSLVLDGINDPGNLGTIIRIADWFGIENIVCSLDTADCYNPKVVQASMGSLFRIKIHYTDLTDFLESQSGQLPVYGMTLQGENIYESVLTSSGFIILGSESNGIRKELQIYLSKSISIPAFPVPEKKWLPDSLNAAVATAIVCAEFRRRRQ